MKQLFPPQPLKNIAVVNHGLLFLIGVIPLKLAIAWTNEWVCHSVGAALRTMYNFGRSKNKY